MRDTLLLVRATLAIYREALRDGSQALIRHWWVIALVPAYTLLLNLAAFVAGGLGMAGGLLLGLAVAAVASSFLTVIDQTMRHERVRFEHLGASFGRYLWNIVSVFFIFWIIQMLLGAITTTNPNLTWVAIAVNAGIFILCNPVPELIYQGQRDGLALVDDAIQFIRENTLEWLLPMAILLSPLFAIGPRAGLLAMATIGPMNALFFVTMALQSVVPAFGGWTPIATVVLAGAVVPWVMLFRGFLFRALYRSGRRQRIFDARMRGL